MVFFKITVLESFKRSLRNLNDEGESSWVKIDYTNLAFTHFSKIFTTTIAYKLTHKKLHHEYFHEDFQF